MKLTGLLVATVATVAMLALACQPGTSHPPDEISDLNSDTAGRDTTDPDSQTDDSGNFDVLTGDADQDASDIPVIPQTCEQTLKNWMCGGDDNDCTDPDATCGGYMASCAETPCWGQFCPFIPGNCLDKINTTVCSNNKGCPDGYSCVKRTFSDLGLCVKLAAEGLCRSDSDCAAEQVCAGEVSCHIGNPCLGPEHSGICMDKPAAELTDACWDSGMCPGGWCSSAVLCKAGNASCTPVPGTCKTGIAPMCEAAPGGPDYECSGSPFGNWCVGTSTESLKWCAPPPASPEADGECWDDSECNVDNAILCRSSLACPPGSYCRVDGYHSGICGPAPAGGEGIELRFADQIEGDTETQVNLTTSSKVILINRGPVAIFFPPCGCAAIVSQRNDEWDNENPIGAFDAPECVQNLTDGTKLRLAPGSGMVLTMSSNPALNLMLAGRLIRLNLKYYVGCVPAKIEEDKCLGNPNLIKNMDAAPVEWPAP
jgi:hypothetical protein